MTIQVFFFQYVGKISITVYVQKKCKSDLCFVGNLSLDKVKIHVWERVMRFLPSIFLDSKSSRPMINRLKLFSSPVAMRYSKFKNYTAELIRLHGADKTLRS